MAAMERQMEPGLVTIFGGSGFVGRYVVQRLADAGYRVRVAVRQPGKALFLKPLGVVGQIQLVRTDVTDPQRVTAAVQGATTVVNLVGILAEGGHQQFDNVQRLGAMHIAASAQAAGVGRLVHVSAIGADINSDARYATSKGAAEAAVQNIFPNATILRPSIIFGPEDQFFNRFAAMANWPIPFLPVIAGDTRFQPVYVQDVAAAIMQAATSPTLKGKTFELGGPTTYRFHDLISYILHTIQSTKPVVEVPMMLAQVQAAFLGLLPKPLLTRDQLKMLAHDNVVGAHALTLADMTITPTPLEAIVPAYLRRYRAKGQFSTDAPVGHSVHQG